MFKPDVYFAVTVRKRYHLKGCAVKHMQEARGLFGFHDFIKCDDCVKTFEGWELWGENGHLQNFAPTRESLCFQVRRMAMSPWQMKDGRMMGYRFRKGSTTYARR
jgi:hypothetical protein